MASRRTFGTSLLPAQKRKVTNKFSGLRTAAVVGADGRNSACRAWAGFEAHRDPERMIIAGALLDGFGGPEDRISLFANPESGQLSFNAPLGGGRFRSYFG